MAEQSPSPTDEEPVANGHTAALNGGPKKSSSKSKSKGKIVDGWLVGGDPRIDADPHFDFGGSWGVSAMMIGFPLLMW